MLFSINYSTQAAVLHSLNRLHVDRFKCPDWDYLVEEALKRCSVAVHFNLYAGCGRISRKNLFKISALAEKTNTPFINIHLEARTNDFPGIPIDSIKPFHFDRVYAQIAADLAIAVKHFGAGRIIIENVPYRPTGKILRASVEPETINRLIEETNCGLLLDISHARITAQNLGMGEGEYLKSLPVHHLQELHITGVHNFDGRLQDHLSMQEADWKALYWVIERIENKEWHKPWMLAFEYGGVTEKFGWRTDAQIIETQGCKLNEICHSIQ